MFIDYVKAYDKVNRNVLLQLLASKGCGNRFIQAVGNSLRNTGNVLGSEYFQSYRGVKQGAANSCALFTFYINGTIQKVKEFGEDGFLGNLHSLLFMDDTVILATSREAMTKKLELLYRAAKGIDMAIHPTKSQFMTVNVADHIPFEIEKVKISYTSTYTYLGSIIEDAPIRDQVKTHIDSKRGHIRKFSSFLRKNAEAPFKVKKVVLESALKGSILYGCESWLCEDMQLVNQVTAAAQKQLLGVRTQTCTDLVQLELSSGSAKSQVQDRQTRFLKKVAMRDDFKQSPVCRAIELAQTAGSPAGRYLQSLLRGTSRPIEKYLERVKARVRQSASSRRVTYSLFNPEQNIHRIYGDATVPESDRVAFTRLRLGSHFLK